MTEDTRPVDVSLFVEEPIEHGVAIDITGGIQVTVDGRRLNRYREPEPAGLKPWNPEYAGDWLRSDLCNWLRATRQVVDGTADRYDPVVIQVEAYTAHFLLERLDADAVRIAFRTTSEPAVPATVACGHPVDVDRLRDSLLDCAAEFVDVVGEYGFTPEDVESVVDATDRLREAGPS